MGNGTVFVTNALNGFFRCTDIKIPRLTNRYASDIYALRLYELIIQWASAKKTPIFEIQEFREKLGVDPNEYSRMFDFKKYVLDLAVKQINENTDIQVKYEQHKHGRTIYGFSFNFVQIKDSDTPERDPNTRDWVEEEDSGSPVADVQALLKKMTNSKPEKKRKVITEQQAELLARVGESWDDLLERIKDDYFVKFDNPKKK